MSDLPSHSGLFKVVQYSYLYIYIYTYACECVDCGDVCVYAQYCISYVGCIRVYCKCVEGCTLIKCSTVYVIKHGSLHTSTIYCTVSCVHTLMHTELVCCTIHMQLMGHRLFCWPHLMSFLVCCSCLSILCACTESSFWVYTRTV